MYFRISFNKEFYLKILVKSQEKIKKFFSAWTVAILIGGSNIFFTKNKIGFYTKTLSTNYKQVFHRTKISYLVF